MKKVMLITVVASVLIFGCSKEEIIEVQEPVNCENHQAESHMPLSVGNYWVYNTYRTDTLGNETITSSTDSVYVDRDTVVNGSTFFILKGDFYATLATGKIIRNENNSLISFEPSSQSEKIIFTNNNPNIIYDSQTVGSLFQVSVWTNSQKKNISVPVGSFNCWERESEAVPLNQGDPWGTRSSFRYYNNSIGVISNHFHFAASPDTHESRLISYNVN